jgi:hypothetical protein
MVWQNSTEVTRHFDSSTGCDSNSITNAEETWQPTHTERISFGLLFGKCRDAVWDATPAIIANFIPFLSLYVVTGIVPRLDQAPSSHILRNSSFINFAVSNAKVCNPKCRRRCHNVYNAKWLYENKWFVYSSYTSLICLAFHRALLSLVFEQSVRLLND